MQAEQITRDEWLARNPIVRKYVESHPVDWMKIESFSLWPEPSSIEGISEHQAEQLGHALSGRIGILGGSPGTGKTYTVAKLILQMLESGLVSSSDIGIGAPTGKAAVRLTENLQKNGLSLRARTWHSLLGIAKNSEADGWSFAHHEGNPFPYRVLVGDESSMMDLSLMLAVFRARQSGCHLLIVGDVNQLPPVGSGAPLRDLIAAKLPYGELREIKRNSGGIVEACAAIRDSDPWLHFTQAKGSNLKITHDESIDEVLDSIQANCTRAEQDGLNPIWDVQVLCAVNDGSKLSRKALNTYLQDLLNPGEKSTGTIFRMRDKAVCTKNGWFKSFDPISGSNEDIQSNDNGEVFVANGELAEIVSIDAVKIVARLENPARVVIVPLRKNSDEEGNGPQKSGSGVWDLGYALSVHKSQGSEWRRVLTILDTYPGARMICDRAWIYTAISRAQDESVLIGTGHTAERFCRAAKIFSRKTFLRELIERKRIVLEMESL
jgi:exodeoxyribonuclease V alpha subunit